MKSSFPLFLGLLTVIASRALGMQYDTAASRKWYEDNLKPMAGGGGYHRNVDRHTKQYKWEKGSDCSHYFLGGQIAANPRLKYLFKKWAKGSENRPGCNKLPRYKDRLPRVERMLNGFKRLGYDVDARSPHSGRLGASRLRVGQASVFN